jgi:cytochrome c peroxidase
MPHLSSLISRASLLLLGVLFSGCQKAHTYDPRAAGKRATDEPGAAATGERSAKRPMTVPDDYAWQDDTGRLPSTKDIPIEFVHEGKQPEEWKKLTAYWNDPGLAGAAAVGLTGLSGMTTLAAVQARLAVRIKVPLGLDDPAPYIPSSNPPTRGKWELGWRLFFDPSWLTGKGEQSCASCHLPGEGFSNSRPVVDDSYNTSTLINCVYNSHQFWDGRARYLEEVVQRTLEDEREPAESAPFRHVWHGVIGRLRKDRTYREDFHRVFGISATQDAVGKALATYMRTILAGNSLHDLAVQQQKQKGAPALDASHYEALLDPATMKALGRPAAVKPVLAGDLLRGYTLFIGRAGCAACHPPGNGHYADGGFHNIGVAAEVVDRPGGQQGRFAVAPYGERNRYLKGAFKTPTLRSLLRTAPYFHNGQESSLEAVVRFHVEPQPDEAIRNRFLDPKVSDETGVHRPFNLGKDDIDVLVLFLKAINGAEVDRSIRFNTN